MPTGSMPLSPVIHFQVQRQKNKRDQSAQYCRYERYICMQERVLVIIPAYNEEKNIREVIQSLKNCHPDYECLVVNDGSKDDTQSEAEANNQATVIQLPV